MRSLEAAKREHEHRFRLQLRVVSRREVNTRLKKTHHHHSTDQRHQSQFISELHQLGLTHVARKFDLFKQGEEDAKKNADGVVMGGWWVGKMTKVFFRRFVTPERNSAATAVLEFGRVFTHNHPKGEFDLTVDNYLAIGQTDTSAPEGTWCILEENG